MGAAAHASAPFPLRQTIVLLCWLQSLLIPESRRQLPRVRCKWLGAGDAHYTYKNARDFRLYGNMEVHNRRELLQWLDKIIEGTQKAHNFHLVSDDEDVLCQSVAVAPGSPVKLPTFVATRWACKPPISAGRRSARKVSEVVGIACALCLLDCTLS